MSLTAFKSGSYVHIVLFFGIGCVFWSILILHKVIPIFERGRKLTQKVHMVRQKLQEYLTMDSIDLVLERKVLVLVEKFSCSAAVQPLNCFDLGYSSALAVGGWLITNIIVLLQFRAGEKWFWKVWWLFRYKFCDDWINVHNGIKLCVQQAWNTFYCTVCAV